MRRVWINFVFIKQNVARARIVVSNKEGITIENLTYKLDFTELISEPTNCQENTSPTCIVLIFCNQPNIVIESGF